MAIPQRRADGAIPVIPGRFYWVLTDRDRTDTADTHYFRTVLIPLWNARRRACCATLPCSIASLLSLPLFSQDGLLIYEGFYRDFGPLNLSQLYRYCKLVQEKLASPGLKDKAIVHYTSRNPQDSSNAAWLAGGTARTPKTICSGSVIHSAAVQNFCYGNDGFFCRVREGRIL
jgi:hypothetical protein